MINMVGGGEASVGERGKLHQKKKAESLGLVTKRDSNSARTTKPISAVGKN